MSSWKLWTQICKIEIEQKNNYLKRLYLVRINGIKLENICLCKLKVRVLWNGITNNSPKLMNLNIKYELELAR